MLENESVTHFFQRCHHCINITITLANDLNQIDNNILRLTDDKVVKVLLQQQDSNPQQLRS